MRCSFNSGSVNCPLSVFKDGDESYCCGMPGNQYCCDRDDYEEEFIQNTIRSLGDGTIAIIIVSALVAVGVIIFLCCCCCSCCWLAKRRSRQSGMVLSPPPQTTTTVTTFAPQGYSQVPQNHMVNQEFAQYPGSGYPPASAPGPMGYPTQPYPTQPYPGQPYPPQGYPPQQMPMPPEYAKPPPYSPN